MYSKAIKREKVIFTQISKNVFTEKSFCPFVLNVRRISPSPRNDAKPDNVVYRTPSNKGRSRIVAAPLTFQATINFLCPFYVAI